MTQQICSVSTGTEEEEQPKPVKKDKESSVNDKRTDATVSQFKFVASCWSDVLFFNNFFRKQKNGMNSKTNLSETTVIWRFKTSK